jgi:hypothetical protein
MVHEANCRSPPPPQRSEFRDRHALAALFGGLGLAFGYRHVAVVHLPIMIFASIVGVWLFSVQHRFENALCAADACDIIDVRGAVAVTVARENACDMALAGKAGASEVLAVTSAEISGSTPGPRFRCAIRSNNGRKRSPPGDSAIIGRRVSARQRAPNCRSALRKSALLNSRCTGWHRSGRCGSG